MHVEELKYSLRWKTCRKFFKKKANKQNLKLTCK